MMRITGGALKGRRIATSEGPGYRPATSRVREALFSMLAARGLSFTGLRVMDVFAGSGSLGIECLSRGASFCRFIEKDRAAAALIRKNLVDLGIERGRFSVAAEDALKVLTGKGDSSYGLVFVDPPYGKDLFAPALARLDAGGWLAPDGFLVAEVESGLSVQIGEPGSGFSLEADRNYGQTRILLCRRTTS
ncbi:methyltransferase [Desulfovibrio sp. X2]|uniref:16S rRNA (guanine(966)-N(2))-methyltransferase RsmD n=1 Tax=Desulfovibrio sp. X2 TaxID=941449 RepID=UPI000358CDC3|nr:16S rRNA (guanine(966)-N(2))-methyltransferase RsmD [Desulfovibrio sp. X2]EPR44075.1 methyltransferase [Desulfovibrio sp. X2]